MEFKVVIFYSKLSLSDEDNDFEHMIDTSEISSKRVFTV